MNRTRVLTIAYPVAGAALLAGSFALMTVGDGRWGLLMFVLLLAAIPVQYAACRDYIRGRRLLMQGEAQQAIPLFEAFLQKVRRRPALRHLVWLGGSVSTPSIEALTLNHLGSAAMVLGDMERSEGWLREALQADPRYAVAFYNLSLLAAHRGDQEEAERLMAEAHRLGIAASVPQTPEPEQR